MPNRTVVVGTWQIQTNDPGSNRSPSLDATGVFDLQTKISTMDAVITDFYRTATAAMPHTSIPPLYIFVAPEYYFKKSIGERCLSRVERNQVIDAMRLLAGSMPNLLLVPGTIIWRKELTAKGLAKAHQRIAARKAFDGGFTVTKELPRKVPGRLARLTGRAAELPDVAYNTAYLYFGQSVYRYHKMNDVGELLQGDTQNDDLVFVPGCGNNVYLISGLKIGVEICGDHDSGMLRDAVDVHIVTSATVARKGTNIRARLGGLFIHADAGHFEVLLREDSTSDNSAFTQQTGQTVTPQITDHRTVKDDFKARWRAQQASIPALQQPTPATLRQKTLLKERIRLMYGGKLTTTVADVDTH